MRRFLLSAAALVVGLALVGSAEAGPKSGPGSSSHGHNDYHLTHGTKFKDGYFFRGHDHSHWSYRYWWPKYGCYTYYCPSSCCWYYWYAPHCCYYPCSYVGSATPVAQAAPVGVASGVTQVVNVANNSPGASTGGGPAAPMPPAPPGP
jgi:hypothetical protein